MVSLVFEIWNFLTKLLEHFLYLKMGLHTYLQKTNKISFIFVKLIHFPFNLESKTTHEKLVSDVT